MRKWIEKVYGNIETKSNSSLLELLEKLDEEGEEGLKNEI